MSLIEMNLLRTRPNYALNEPCHLLMLVAHCRVNQAANVELVALAAQSHLATLLILQSRLDEVMTYLPDLGSLHIKDGRLAIRAVCVSYLAYFLARLLSLLLGSYLLICLVTGLLIDVYAITEAFKPTDMLGLCLQQSALLGLPACIEFLLEVRCEARVVQMHVESNLEGCLR